MKKLISILLVLVMIFVITGCGKSVSTKNYDIVCCDFASYSWVTEMLSYEDTGIDVVLLNDEGVDVHSFEPSVEDIAMMKDAKLVVCMGGSSEAWVESEMFENFKNQDNSVAFICLIDYFMTSSVFTTYDDRDDEHIWASIGYAIDAVNVLKSAIETNVMKDSSNSKIKAMKASADSYIEELTTLKNAYDNMNPKKPVIIADRNPFNYLLSDAGIEYMAAFDGCSAETEASFETITELANYINDNELQTVLYLDNGTQSFPDILDSVTQASTYWQENGGDLRGLYSMDANFSDEINLDTSYVSLMWTNYYTLAAATGGNTEPEM